MALDAALPAVPRAVPLARGLTARVALTLVVAGSFAVRVVTSALHPVPRYFPDEYLYTAIARALGTGHAPAVRGESAHFPALLAPVLAAPFHALGSPELAYRLTQAENALLMSLAAVPVYLLARRLALSPQYSLACAVFGVAIPDLVFSSYTMADPVAYPFALGALAAGVVALERRTRSLQVAFLALAGLATFARVQYVVLFVAFAVATAVLDRRRGVWALGALVLLALGASQVLGYYSNVAHLHLGTGLAHWAVTDLFLLALASGVVLVPGALVALARPRGRTQLAFTAIAVPFAAGLLFEAALYASNGSARFQERYLFSLLPLVPVAFGVYLRNGRPHARAVAVLALVLFAVSARVPVSGYAEGLGRTDSPFLFAVTRLQDAVGVGNGSLLVALGVALAAAAAVLVARRGGGRFAFAGAVALVGACSVGAVLQDAATARQVRHELVAATPSWVDASGLRDVTLVQTPGAAPAQALEQLYWNRSVTREALLDDATATDVYTAPRLRIAADGSLLGVHGSVLLQGYAVTARFRNAHLAGSAGSFSLWRADETPRLSLLERGRSFDGWLGRAGRISLWPDANGRTRGVLRFTLSLPGGSEPVRVRFGRSSFVVEPGGLTEVALPVDAHGMWSVPFRAGASRVLQDGRVVSVQSSAPTFARAGAPGYTQSLSA